MFDQMMVTQKAKVDVANANIKAKEEAYAKLAGEKEEMEAKLAGEKEEMEAKLAGEKMEMEAKLAVAEEEACAKLAGEKEEMEAKLAGEKEEMEAKLAGEKMEMEAKLAGEKMEMEAKLAGEKSKREVEGDTRLNHALQQIRSLTVELATAKERGKESIHDRGNNVLRPDGQSFEVYCRTLILTNAQEIIARNSAFSRLQIRVDKRSAHSGDGMLIVSMKDSPNQGTTILIMDAKDAKDAKNGKSHTVDYTSGVKKLVNDAIVNGAPHKILISSKSGISVGGSTIQTSAQRTIDGVLVVAGMMKLENNARNDAINAINGEIFLALIDYTRNVIPGLNPNGVQNMAYNMAQHHVGGIKQARDLFVFARGDHNVFDATLYGAMEKAFNKNTIKTLGTSNEKKMLCRKRLRTGSKDELCVSTSSNHAKQTTPDTMTQSSLLQKGANGVVVQAYVLQKSVKL
jgi:hypothetical protein